MERFENFRNNDKLAALKDRAVNHMLIVVAIYSLASSYFVIIRLFQFGYNPMLVFRISLNVLIIALFIFRNSLAIMTKILLIVFINIIIYISSLRYLAFFAADNLLLAIVPIFLSFVIRFKYAVYGLVAFLLVYIVYAWLFTSYTIEEFIYQTDSVRNVYVWAVIGIGFTAISFGTMVIVHNYSESLLAFDNVLIKQNTELKENQDRYKILFENSNDSILILKDGIIFTYNKKTLELFKCDDDYLKGRYPYELSPEKQLDGKLSIDKANEQVEKLKLGESMVFDWLHMRPDGELFEVSVSVSMVLLNNEYITQSILRDVTIKRKLERDLRMHKENLEKLVEEKTKDYEEVNEDLRATNEELHATNEEMQTTNEELYLKNDMIKNQNKELEKVVQQLQDAQEKLVQSEKMASLGVLTAGVAHEINNPLNFIQSGIYALENAFENKKGADEIAAISATILENMQLGVNRASAIVRSLNTFSRKSKGDVREFNIHETIENVLLMLNHELKHKCKVVKSFSDEIPPVMGVEESLHQAFLNVLSNAAQALGETDGVIEIKTEVKGAFLEVSIIDNGAGIPEDVKQKIFDPFFTTKDPGKGVGLGLSIVYKIIQDHKGEISYQSEVNKGTTALIKLPLNREA